MSATCTALQRDGKPCPKGARFEGMCVQHAAAAGVAEAVEAQRAYSRAAAQPPADPIEEQLTELRKLAAKAARENNLDLAARLHEQIVQLRLPALRRQVEQEEAVPLPGAPEPLPVERMSDGELLLLHVAAVVVERARPRTSPPPEGAPDAPVAIDGVSYSIRLHLDVPLPPARVSIHELSLPGRRALEELWRETRAILCGRVPQHALPTPQETLDGAIALGADISQFKKEPQT